MKLKELFEDLSESISDKLYEMAFSRKDIESKISSLSIPLIAHLIKVLKWEDVLNYNKHLGDINSWLFDIQAITLKGNKKPKQQDYFQWIFLDTAHNLITVKRKIKGLHQYQDLKVIATDEQVYEKLLKILTDVSIALSQDKFEDIKNFL
jgi:hypothetical protein